jgi:hypothetical protein
MFRQVLSHPQTVQELYNDKIYNHARNITKNGYLYFVKIIIFKSCNCHKFYGKAN